MIKCGEFPADKHNSKMYREHAKQQENCRTTAPKNVGFFVMKLENVRHGNMALYKFCIVL